MFGHSLLRQAPRAAQPLRAAFSPTLRWNAQRTFQSHTVKSTDQSKNSKDDRHDAYSTSGQRGEFEEEGQHSRTDSSIVVKYPEEHQVPRSRPVRGRGGPHDKRTLATFSLEGRVALITGGARGLGLVMSQALVESGASVAIVDLNSA